MALKLTRDIVVRSKFLTRKDERTGEIISVLAPNGLQIGISGSDRVTAEFKSYGDSYFYSGLSGSLTRLTDGTSYIVGGSGTTVTTSSAGQITITGGGSGTPGGSDTQVQFNDGGSFAGDTGLTFNKTTNDLHVEGYVTSSSGFSGSLTTLADGTSYLIAGSNMTITSASNGSVTLAAAGGSGSPGGSDTQIQYNNGGSFGGAADFTFNDSTGDLTIGASTSDSKLFFRDVENYVWSPSSNTLSFEAGNQVLILSGGAGTSFDESTGTDVAFYVSGSVDSLETAERGSSIFGGDLYTSGTTILSGTSHQAIPKNFSAIGGGAGGFMYSGIYPNMITLDVTGSGDNAFIEIGKMFSDNQYPYALTGSKDAFLYVSGSAGSRGTNVRGTAVFGGDIATSGSIYLLSEDSSASAAPKIVLNRSGSSPADDDLLGEIIFEGSDENGNIHAYARMTSETNDVTAGAEDGVLTIKVTREGTERSILKLANNEIAFNDDSKNIDFRYETDDRSKGFYIDASENQVLFLSGGAGTSVDETQGADIAFYVSGSIGTRTTSARGTTLFGGDLVTSGGMYINVGGNSVGDFRVESDGEDEAIFLDASAETLYVNKGESDFTTQIHSTNDVAMTVGAAGVIFNEDGHATNDFRVESDNKTNIINVDAGEDQVIFGANGTTTDTFLFVSGATASRGVASSKGTTLFGGDVYTSGSLFVSGSGASATTMPKLSVGCSPTTPAKVALDVEYDFSTHTFENQLANGEGGGTRLRYGEFHSSIDTAGRLCNLTIGSSIWRAYTANSTTQSGSILATALDVDGGADEGLVLLRGFIKVSSGLINGTASGGIPLYASNDTAGEYDVDVPSDSDDVVRIVGYCIDVDSSHALVWFDPDKTWVTLS